MTRHWASRLGILFLILTHAILFGISMVDLVREERLAMPALIFFVLWPAGSAIAWTLYIISNVRTDSERTAAMWRYPRYLRDVMTWWLTSGFLTITIVGLSIGFFARHGIDASPSFAAPLANAAAMEYAALLFVSTMASFFVLYSGIDAYWADGFETYFLVRVRVPAGKPVLFEQLRGIIL